ncbi:MAG: hypothetical protein Q4B70_03480 [Lachnospiraceae bacterium]|nr:hypothetical protein [Lachnospiraceae bacterium]
MIYFEHPKFELNMDKLCRRLRIDKDNESNESIRKQLPALRKIAEENTELKILYLEGDGYFKTGIEDVDRCEKQLVCLCYTTEKILDLINGMMADGDFFEAYIINDMANEALFNASNRMNEHIFQKMKEEGRNLTEKYSPGEDGIPLEYQKDYLDLLLAETDLEVTINKSYMLIPEKTMMYTYGADTTNPEISVAHDCRKCSKTDCYFREIDLVTV